MPDVNTKEMRGLIQEELTKFFKGSWSYDGDQLLSREEAAGLLGVKSNTLATWAMKGTGPAPTKVGTKSMYRRSVLEAYITKNTMPRQQEVS